MKNEGANKKIIIISGPSGSGEDSVIEGLSGLCVLDRVITTTTRSLRPGESQGKPYYFVSHEQFHEAIERGDFFEYTEQDLGNYYGVTRQEMDRVMASAHIAIWKIDYQGVISAKDMLGDRMVSIFISAPLDVIEQRIRKRNVVTEEFVAARLSHAKGWFEHKAIFDYEVENKEGKLAETIAAVHAIITKELMLDKKGDL